MKTNKYEMVTLNEYVAELELEKKETALKILLNKHFKTENKNERNALILEMLLA